VRRRPWGGTGHPFTATYGSEMQCAEPRAAFSTKHALDRRACRMQGTPPREARKQPDACPLGRFVSCRVGRPSGSRTLETAIEPGPCATRGRPSLALQRCPRKPSGVASPDRSAEPCRSPRFVRPRATCHRRTAEHQHFFWGARSGEARAAGFAARRSAIPCATGRFATAARQGGNLTRVRRHAAPWPLTARARATYHRRALTL
jgi:hypothetical protein